MKKNAVNVSILKSIKGFFGQTIQYKDGIRIGESWDGLIPGTKKHYGANGEYVGSSAPGFFADEVHYDQYGVRIGESWSDDLGTTRHYDARGRIGTSYDGLLGTITHTIDDVNTLFEQSEDRDPFTDDVPCSDLDW